MTAQVQWFPARPSSVTAARQFVTWLLHGSCEASRLDEARLMVSELAANAVLHARTDFSVSVEALGAVLEIGVTDRSRELPRERVPDPDGGQGLHIVSELAGRWGCRERGRGQDGLLHDAARAPGGRGLTAALAPRAPGAARDCPPMRARILFLAVVTAVAAGLVGGAASPVGATTTNTTRPPEPTVVTDATQPTQPQRGPGGSEAKHRDWRVGEGGTGADAWYVFEPIDPKPRSAPVAVMLHGYYEFAGYAQLQEFIRHTVLRGSIVIYPRWQTGVAAPCPGPYDIEPCMQSAVTGIKGALDYLRADPNRVQPKTKRTIYFGHSFGGIITTNLANRYRSLGIPKPRAVFLDDPHDGGLNGHGEVALDDSLDGIPRDTLFVCHSGAEGVLAEPGKAASSCNAVFPKLTTIPARNKSLVMTHPDHHGVPPLSSRHGVCTAFPGRADDYDWSFCWRTFDALRTASVDGTDREDALGRSVKHTDLGAWSDGVAVVPLEVRRHAPLEP